MGFFPGVLTVSPVKVFLQFILFLLILLRIVSRIFDALGFSELLDPDSSSAYLATDGDLHRPRRLVSVSATLIKEMLPTVHFADLLIGEWENELRLLPHTCSVCLYDFEQREEVRRLSNCRHVFHRCCLDRWIEYDQRNCPLCRMPLVPKEMREAFDRRLRAAYADPSDGDDDVDLDDTDFSSPRTPSILVSISS
ncbi:hypothetical protein HPP92_025629 [Vanilla planifolia]|uniref:RING-type domain-containing protein n=1 Tax=Vanilla planifolia TaxID=51239 RepID=A0A835U9J1_VANPL|nr:hypothetical protein HPP92_025629 [Vanilla planifolia]